MFSATQVWALKFRLRHATVGAMHADGLTGANFAADASSFTQAQLAAIAAV